MELNTTTKYANTNTEYNQENPFKAALHHIIVNSKLKQSNTEKQISGYGIEFGH